MIKSWRHKGLKELFETGSSRKVRQDQRKRVLRRLDVLDQAASLKEIDIPGFDLHELHGKPRRWAIAVNGPWRVTFEWAGGDAFEVDLEQYH